MPQTGLIFDIQRTSFHDGPGIRTAVFFKGCPLHCLWCHNPESRNFRPQVSFHAGKCTSCLSCLDACDQNAHQVDNGVHVLDHSRCKACGACLSCCPNDALKMIGEEWTVEQVLAEVERDLDFYLNSGGGITLTGGEPMSQFSFARELLRACREAGIHTCIETCGIAPEKKYREILPLTDIFLFDYKATNPDRHQELTGVVNDVIISNLAFLYHQGAAIILRCPLIPGINDSPEHLAGIARLAVEYPNLLGIEIMAYHDLGRDKGLRVGQDFPLAEVKTADDQQKELWLSALSDLGCVNVAIG